AALSENITPFRDAFQVPGVPTIWNWSTELGRIALDAQVTRQALTIAYINDFRFMMYLSMLALPLLLLLRPPQRAKAAR
ncbi:MAG TPA: EmrB/QacA family drug resistance transporter, partial [Gammaproteobacteria bacterium]|nr:EmrB/QacA family drug resistance transporter [Gammaproteobacteria bacterium]